MVAGLDGCLALDGALADHAADGAQAGPIIAGDAVRRAWAEFDRGVRTHLVTTAGAFVGAVCRRIEPLGQICSASAIGFESVALELHNAIGGALQAVGKRGV